MNKLYKAIGLASLLTIASATLAATNGQLGSTSTGTINISLMVQEQIQVKNLQDFNMDIAQNADPASLQEVSTGCVVSNNQSGMYTLTARNQQGSSNGAFQLKNAQGQAIGYNLAATDGSSMQTLNNGNAQLQASRDVNCQDGKTLQLHLSLARDAKLQPGQYNDVMELQVVPL